MAKKTVRLFKKKVKTMVNPVSSDGLRRLMARLHPTKRVL